MKVCILAKPHKRICVIRKVGEVPREYYVIEPLLHVLARAFSRVIWGPPGSLQHIVRNAFRSRMRRRYWDAYRIDEVEFGDTRSSTP